MANGGKFVADYAHRQLPKDLEYELAKQENRMHHIAKVGSLVGAMAFVVGACYVFSALLGTDRTNPMPENTKDAVIQFAVIGCVGFFVGVASAIAAYKTKPKPRTKLGDVLVEGAKEKSPVQSLIAI